MLLLTLVSLLLSRGVAQAPGDENSDCPQSYPDTWRVLMDSWRYKDLLDDRNAVWEEISVDGDSYTWTPGVNGICGRDIRSCDYYTQGVQDNWLFTQHISTDPAEQPSDYSVHCQVYVNITYSGIGCVSSMGCIHRFDVYHYLVDTPQSTATQRDTSRYSLLQEIQTSGSQEVTRVLKFDLPPNQNGFYLAFRDPNTCVTIDRVIVYRKRAVLPSVSYADDGILRCAVTSMSNVTFSWTISSSNFECDTDDDYCRLEMEGDEITSTLTVNIQNYGVGQIPVTCTVTVDGCPSNNSIVISVGDDDCLIVSQVSIETQTSYATEISKPVTLFCEYEVQLCSVYTYQWFKENVSISSIDSSNLQIADSGIKYVLSLLDFSLQITDSETSDSSNYHCQLFVRNSSGHGRTFEGRSVFVEVYDAALIVRDPFAQVVHEDTKNIEFVCSARGIPLPTIQWLFDGRPIEWSGLNSSGTTIIDEADDRTMGTLSINTTKALLESVVRAGYNAPITCQATNSPNTRPGLLLSDMATVNITVMGINECELEIDDCDENATCADTDTYTCTCNKWFVGNGLKCTFDECTSGSHNCHQNATCTDTDDGFSCECDEEFVGNGSICTPGDPISTESDAIAIGTSIAVLVVLLVLIGGSVFAVLICWWHYQRHMKISVVMDNVTVAGYMDGNNSAYGYVEELVRVR